MFQKIDKFFNSLSPLDVSRYLTLCVFAANTLIESIPLFIHGVLRHAVVFHTSADKDMSMLQLQTNMVLLANAFLIFHFGFWLSKFQLAIRVAVIVAVFSAYYFFVASSIRLGIGESETFVTAAAAGNGYLLDFVQFVFVLFAMIFISELTKKYV